MDDPKKKERPGIITALCVLGFFGGANVLYTTFTSPFIKALGATYQTCFVLSALLSTTALIGLWNMKKWGVVLYALVMAGNIVLLLSAGVFNLAAIIVGAVISLAVVIALFTQFPKMD
jgi:hypothetical protein